MKLSLRSILQGSAACLLSASLLVLTGCGMQGALGNGLAGNTTNAVGIRGGVQGGNQPIAGAMVKIYAAASTGVATKGVYVPAANVTPLGSITTDPSGNFTFATPLTCTTGQQIYATAAGGNPGNGSSNPNILLMAAVGPCPAGGSLGGIYIWINEVTTVAAAYALSSFTTVSGTGASAVVNVTSSATNYTTVNTTNGTFSEAGLLHAFQNAANLANYSTGTANTTITTLASGQSTTAPAVVPQAEINTLADALQTCVNSTGGTASATPPAAVAISTPTASSTSTGSSFTLTAGTTGNETGTLSLKNTAVTSETVSAYSITSNVATFTVPNNFVAGETVVLSGFATSTFLNGTVTVLAGGLSSTQFTASITHADVPNTTESGTAKGTIVTTVALTPSGTSQTALAGSINSGLSGIGGTAVNTSGTVITVTGPVNTTVTANAFSTTGTALYQDASDGTQCGELFTYTTPTVAFGNQAASTAPTNTLQAMLNLAKFPYMNNGAVVPVVFNMVTPNPTFAPVMTTQPTDWSLSIVYTIQNLPTGTQTYPYVGTIDMYDNVYAFVPYTSTPATGSPAEIYSFASNGTQNWIWTTSTLGATYTLAVDNLASPNLWLNQNSTVIVQLPLSVAAANGTGTTSYTGPANSVKGLAIDLANDVWLGRAGTTSNQVSELIYNPALYSANNNYGPLAAGVTGTGFSNGATNGALGMQIDKNQNIWYAGYYSAGTTVTVLPNTGTVSSPAYTSNGYKFATLGGGNNTPYSVAIDANGNAWSIGNAATTFGLQQFTPTLTSGVITGLVAGTSYTTGATFSSPRFVRVDGANNVWVSDSSTRGIYEFNIASSAYLSESSGYQACLVIGGACGKNGTTGGAPTGAVVAARDVWIDSTGAAWIIAGTTLTANPGYGTVVQMFGPGSPTWAPSANNPGVMP